MARATLTNSPWDPLARIPLSSLPGTLGTWTGCRAEAAEAARRRWRPERRYTRWGPTPAAAFGSPASMCGVVGLKPTYGLVSRFGLVAYASSLDQVGIIAQDVTDTALVLNAIAGQDHRDSTSLPRPETDYADHLTGDSPTRPLATAGREGTIRLGVPEEYFVEGMQDGVREAVETAIGTLEALGASVQPVSLPSTRYALACYYIIAPSECSANLARYDGVKYGYSYQDTNDMWEAMEQTRHHGLGPEVKRRIMLGAYALSAGYYDAYYLKAQQARTLIRRDFDRVFQQVDALVTPTSPVVAFPLGEKINDPVEMYLIDVCTLPVNIAGLPAISLPCGFSEGLPVGLQLIGPHLSEKRLLGIAHAYEQATEWHRKKPEME